MDIKSVVSFAEQHGFVAEKKGTNRTRFRHPQGGRMIVASPMGADWRGNKNALADLRRVMRELGIPEQEKS
jgi:hypothetical protein